MNEQAAIVLSNNNHVSNITTSDRGSAIIDHPPSHTEHVIGNTTSRRRLLGSMLTEEATIGNMHAALLSRTLLGLLLTPLVSSLERAGITGANNKKDELSSSPSLSSSSSAWLLDGQGPPSAWHSGLEKYQKHRSTLFFPLLCQLGLPSLCVCTGAGLQAAIDAGNRWVIVCPGVMQLSTEIDLTGATLQIFCGALFGLRP